MKKFLSLGLALTTLIIAGQASAANLTYVAADMDGNKVKPNTVNSAFTGRSAITFDDVTGKFCASTKFTPSNFARTDIFIHEGNAEASDGEVLQEISGDDSDEHLISGTLTEDALGKLKTGESYVQAYSAAYASGELRAQLVRDDDAEEVTCANEEQDGGVDGGDAGDVTPTDDGGVTTTPQADSGTGSDGGESSGAPLSPESTDSSCSTTSPGSSPLGVGFGLVAGVAIAAAFRRRRRSN